MRDLQADLEICNKATRGPWEYVTETTYVEDYPFSTADRVKIGNETLTVYCCAPDFDGGKKYKADAQFIAQAREGWPHAIERAIKAEAKFTECRKAAEVLQSEVERLKQMVKSITGELDEVIETNQYLEAELDKYKRAYAEICHQFNFGNESDYIAMYNYWLDWAEKEGE